MCEHDTLSNCAHNVITSARGIKHAVIYLLPVFLLFLPLSFVGDAQPPLLFTLVARYGHTHTAAGCRLLL